MCCMLYIESLCDSYPHTRAEIHELSKNLGAISKGKAPEG